MAESRAQRRHKAFAQVLQAMMDKSTPTPPYWVDRGEAEGYQHGYKHALADARAKLAESSPESWSMR